MLSSHAAVAQVPLLDPSFLPPLTENDVAPAVRKVTPGEPKQEPTAKTDTLQAASAESAVPNKLRDLITGSALDRLVSRKIDREGIAAYYSAHNYVPLWVSNSAVNERAKSATAYLAQADAVGLDPNDYPTPDFKSAVTADSLAEAELKLTTSALTFARHAQIGRIHFTRVGTDIQYELVAPDPADVLSRLADGNDAGKVLNAFNPPQSGFKALRAKLAELRKGSAAPDVKKAEMSGPPRVYVPDGKILRPGMQDARVVVLRKRLDIPGDKDNPLYDEAVRDAVKIFQTENDIGVDGNIGPNTVRALNGERKETRGPLVNPIDTIIVNMERWRWLPRDLGNPHVIVNVPDYTLTLYNEGHAYWKSKIVVGKPTLATPMISAEMKFITVNPTWNVPQSIIEKEYLPALQVDPQALERIGLKVAYNQDGSIHIWQPPGAANALGRIRFNFPNKFLVYQHDTPDKYLFARERRAFSHGCMRVENPLTYAEKLLSLVMPNENYTEARLEKMFGGKEINLNFPKFIQVHLTYQTAFVDEQGKLQLREDIYGRDSRMIALLKGSERKVADNAIGQRSNSSPRPMHIYQGYYRGPSFFGFLFGGPRFAPPRPPRAGINAYAR
ncbi:MAG: L,D-transpeptidase family protein [Pseudolabrys sp.]